MAIVAAKILIYILSATEKREAKSEVEGKTRYNPKRNNEMPEAIVNAALPSVRKKLT
jgi:hypothetical protein